MKPRHPWSALEITLLRELYPDVTAGDVAALLARPIGSVYQAAAKHGISKSTAFHASDASGRVKHGQQHPGMRAHQFKPGQTPWNKGAAFDPGGRSHETRFKAGQRSGKAAQHWQPVGSYRTNREGYLDRKISDAGRGPRDWEAVHRLVWKAANGAIPKGHIIVFRPGRRSAVLELITPDAVECISRAEHARRNHPRNKSPELGRLIQLKGAITRQVNRIAREAQERSTTP